MLRPLPGRPCPRHATVPVRSQYMQRVKQKKKKKKKIATHTQHGHHCRFYSNNCCSSVPFCYYYGLLEAGCG